MKMAGSSSRKLIVDGRLNVSDSKVLGIRVDDC